MLNDAAVQQAYGRYQRVMAETASPGQLVLMLYQGGIRFSARARLALQDQDFEAARTNLLRAQDIVAELMSSLNLEAGDIASNLLRLYEYMHRRLVEANIRRDAAAAREVEELLRSLVPAWEEAIRQHPQTARSRAAAGANPLAVPATSPLPAG